MDVRDAVEADAEALAALADAPVDVMRNLVHDRTVRVVTDECEDEDRDDHPADGTPTDPATMRGFVSYDARENTVYVTQIGGKSDICGKLLAEPIQFARREEMDVEVLVAVDDGDLQDAVEGAGFVREGSGPQFDGQETIRYRWTG